MSNVRRQYLDMSVNSAKTPKKKGDALEEAVRAIEAAILRSVPGLAEGTFKIQGNRIFNVGGVRHEIDVYVTASLPAGYDSVFIFECKHWRRKVGKNELIVFSEKIAVTGAQRGFFIASRFTKDAQAQAAKDPRVQLLTGMHFEPVTRVTFPTFRLQFAGATDANVKLLSVPGEAAELSPLELRGKRVLLDERVYDADVFAREKTIAVRDSFVNCLPLETLTEGTQRVKFSGAMDFAEGSAEFDGRPLRRIEIDGSTELTVALGSVLSVFEIATRGRMLVVGASAEGLEIQAHLVELHH